AFRVGDDAREGRVAELTEQRIVVDPDDRHLLGDPEAAALAGVEDVQPPLVVAGHHARRPGEPLQPAPDPHPPVLPAPRTRPPLLPCSPSPGRASGPPQGDSYTRPTYPDRARASRKASRRRIAHRSPSNPQKPNERNPRSRRCSAASRPIAWSSELIRARP